MSAFYYVDDIIQTKNVPFCLPEINCVIGPHSVILPPSHLEEDINISSDCRIFFSHLRNVKIGAESLIIHSQLRDIEAKEEMIVYYSTLLLSKFGKCVKIKHHSFVFSSFIEDETNINAGCYLEDAFVGEKTVFQPHVVIAANNGYNDSKTKIGDRCFIGANVTIVAPCEIANEVYIEPGVRLSSSASIPPHSLVAYDGQNFRIDENRIFHFEEIGWIITEKSIDVSLAHQIQAKFRELLELIKNGKANNKDFFMSREEVEKKMNTFKHLDEHNFREIFDFFDQKIKSLA